MTPRAPGLPLGNGLLLAAAIALAASCGGKKNGEATTASGEVGTVPDADKVLLQQGDLPDGLAIRLSDGQDGPYQPVRVRPAKATKLSDAAAKALLGRMSPLKSEADDRKGFALRERSKPAPRTGKTIEGQFPPPDQIGGGPPPAATNQTGKDLQIVRWAPEGDVPLAPHLSVTFSQPMIAVTSHDDTTAGGVPVKLTPTPKGKWRWVGTRTLLFDPDVRFPQATEYRVEIPAGTKSKTGGVLKEAKKWTFKTPAPRVERFYPSTSPQPRDPVMFALFDQAVDPAKVLSTIKVRAGANSYGVRAASAAELEKNRELESLIEAADKGEKQGRYVAFRVAEKLPVDTRIEVNIGPGTPSAEGPLTTKSAQSHSFRTYAPLQVDESRCSWGSNCPPMTPWFIRFNNPLDLEKFDPESIRISPELAGYRAEANDRYLYIRGRSKGRTTYTVTLPANLTDKFGQTLQKDRNLTFRVGSAEPRFLGAARSGRSRSSRQKTDPRCIHDQFQGAQSQAVLGDSQGLGRVRQVHVRSLRLPRKPARFSRHRRANASSTR